MIPIGMNKISFDSGLWMSLVSVLLLISNSIIIPIEMNKNSFDSRNSDD